VTRSKYFKILTPSVGEAATAGGLSLLFFVIIFRDPLILRHLPGDIVNSPYFHQSYMEHLNRVSKLPFTDILVKGLFWAGLGLGAYLVFLLISNAVIELRNQVVVESQYTNRGQSSQRYQKPILQVASAAGFLIFLSLSINWLLPYWLNLFGSGVQFFPQISGLPLMLLAVVGAGGNLYLLWANIQLILNAD
jgi:hypothetical protein